MNEILTKYKTVAIVGLSRDASKDSYRVAAYLKTHGFRIVPVNPYVDEVLGEKSYKSLVDVPTEVLKTIEIVDIFRPAIEVLPIVEQIIRLKESYGVPQVIWMQPGIVNEQASEIARKAGLVVIVDKCMMREHRKIVERNN